jgi:hypothetical protein
MRRRLDRLRSRRPSIGAASAFGAACLFARVAIALALAHRVVEVNGIHDRSCVPDHIMTL